MSTDDTSATLRHSPLDARHRALGAKLSDFGGWEMPIEYPDGGVVREHTAVREAVGIFDVSHLGNARVTGPGAADFVNRCLTNDLRRLEVGQAQYTLCCAEDGGVVDDLIAYLRSDEEVFLVPNAANTAEVVRRLTAAAPEGITVTDEHGDFGIVAVQGPRSADVLAAVGLPSEHPYMSFVDAELQLPNRESVTVTVCRTGYTGERGYELVMPWDATPAVWDLLLGSELEVRPCGLGARDTLRTEMGYPLHGQDLSLEITPVQARLGWAVGWQKGAFWGREALLAEREAGPRRVLRGLDAVDRAIPRHGMDVVVDGAPVGTVTSGTFSPTLRHGIALALLDPAVEVGDTVQVDVRGRAASFRVVKPPFVEAGTN
ncbi:MAG: glycine cleavage system aminomethyltransferase GcvT [Actinomycetes bacterium]